MSDPFLGEIRPMSFNFAPRGWAFCNGQLLPINQHQALFSLLGTTYGGNGVTTFALPDLRGRTQVHFGGSYLLGHAGGEESHTVSTTELPTHTHFLRGAATAAGTRVPTGAMPAVAPDLYGPPTSLVPLAADSVTAAGGSQPHENRQPYLVITFCIALQGIFPSRS